MTTASAPPGADALEEISLTCWVARVSYVYGASWPFTTNAEVAAPPDVFLRRADGGLHEEVSATLALSVSRHPSGIHRLAQTALQPYVVAIAEQFKDYFQRHGATTGAFARTQQTEFLRHLRNAASHNNKWHFTGAEPTRAAAHNGLTLDATMHGRGPVLMGKVMAGDVLDLYRDLAAAVAAHLGRKPPTVA
ncbi:MAG: hypothetical protein QOE05_1254 [Actinomycetota bacterium]|jgi:hypothetical protein|nr:hypothetical protein [Actinomycetota bacterium]